MSTIAGLTLPAIAAAFAGRAPVTLSVDPLADGSTGGRAPPRTEGAKGAAAPPVAGVADAGVVDGRTSWWVTAAPPTAPATTSATAAAPRIAGRLRAPSDDAVAAVGSELSGGATQSWSQGWIVWRVMAWLLARAMRPTCRLCPR